MKLSVIIPCRNNVHTLGDQLQAVLRQDWSDDWEMIVADNGSTDGSVEKVKSFQKRVDRLRFVEAAERQGWPYARNVAIRLAKGDALLFTDADDMVGEGWLQAMGAALERHDFVAARLEFLRLNVHLGKVPAFSHQTEGLQKLWYPPYLAHAGGGTLGIKRAVHDAVNGFDESWYRLCDTDYCVRIQRLGVPLQFVPDAVIHIRARSSAGGGYNQARLWARYNTLLYKKYRGNSAKLHGAWRQYFDSWRRLIRQWRMLRTPANRMKWLWGVGWQVGLLQGALMYRVNPVCTE